VLREDHMRLGYVKFSGYKRFRNETTLSLNSKMVALIGPNEAGKTSTLKLLKHISNDNAFNIDEYYKYDDATTPQLLACFFLEKKDHAELNSSAPKKLIVSKTADGVREFLIEPELKRIKKYRKPIINETKKCLSNIKFLRHLDDLELGINSNELLEELERIDVDLETLREDDLKPFETLLSCIPDQDEESELPKYIFAFSSKISEFLTHERNEHPNDKAINIAKELIPSVIEFSAADRKLETSYNMSTYKHPSRRVINLIGFERK